jgi:hypothetical protein
LEGAEKIGIYHMQCSGVCLKYESFDPTHTKKQTNTWVENSTGAFTAG